MLDERDCPDQILLGAMDTDFCVLIALGCYLETLLSTKADGHRFLFGNIDDDDEPIRINERYQRWLGKVWKHEEFMALVAQVKGSIGTHSVRKFPCTWCAEHGVSQDHTEIRGRWKGKQGGKTVNRYINVEQLPTDGHVASVLCVGGPIRYMCRTGSGLEMKLDWMHDNVVPGIYNYFNADPSNRVADVLAHAVLFAACQPGLEHLLPLGVGDRIRHAWSQVRPDDFH